MLSTPSLPLLDLLMGLGYSTNVVDLSSCFISLLISIMVIIKRATRSRRLPIATLTIMLTRVN